MFKKLSVKELVVIAGLSALSTVTQLVHIGYRSPQFGMWIDVVAVSWIIAFFLFGARISFIVSILGAVMITLFAPDTWLGASMKWIASAPMWISLSLWAYFLKRSITQYRKFWFLLVPIVVGLLIRCLITIPLNYYYAIPIWTGMTTSQAMTAIPWYIIALFNIIQGLFDVIFAWIIVFKFQINRFSSIKQKEE